MCAGLHLYKIKDSTELLSWDHQHSEIALVDKTVAEAQVLFCSPILLSGEQFALNIFTTYVVVVSI